MLKGDYFASGGSVVAGSSSTSGVASAAGGVVPGVVPAGVSVTLFVMPVSTSTSLDRPTIRFAGFDLFNRLKAELLSFRLNVGVTLRTDVFEFVRKLDVHLDVLIGVVAFVGQKHLVGHFLADANRILLVDHGDGQRWQRHNSRTRVGYGRCGVVLAILTTLELGNRADRNFIVIVRRLHGEPKLRGLSRPHVAQRPATLFDIEVLASVSPRPIWTQTARILNVVSGGICLVVAMVC